MTNPSPLHGNFEKVSWWAGTRSEKSNGIRFSNDRRQFLVGCLVPAPLFEPKLFNGAKPFYVIASLLGEMLVPAPVC